ncbi:hypothetical protein GUITHDRAFT_104307 [Guillardia theta CCMP2712]|uniref:Protein kinase domain-containing protein n=1 Tax=Guillardia theta (strain CCMP2712) TaxID=905079 RepID=L1JNZ0_GUITC|nr:hypothetical protein GUITHDRAFT_104307 [Guillardia theta CCMP2712]EKX49910.1 hypothetical protein GUITHDRAFT_104307 [Guillardia theta CCMP2712]|eukprot:XP_005836890.1 hypothetical protein GUITHDRAFT_104307 [Guillardia theta CCMP2712]
MSLLAQECPQDGEPLWASEDYDDQNEFDALTAGLNNRIGTLPNPTIEHAAIKKKRQLGAGGFAIVYEADAPRPSCSSSRSQQNGPCACKVFSFIAGMGERQTNFFKNWLHELKVLDYLSKRPECGVVDFYGFSLQHDQADAKIVVQICMELMKGGSLRDNLLRLPLPLAFTIMRQVAMALRGLHAPEHDVFGTNKFVSIVHRDLKPENVLLSEKLTSGKPSTIVCKLCDVGLAALRTDPSLQTVGHATTKVGKAGTYPYIAPETLLQGKCTPASDVFSLGLLMWELIVGDIPFHDVPNLDGMLPIFWQDGRRPPLDVEPFESVPRKLRQLIEKCWNADRYNWL